MKNACLDMEVWTNIERMDRTGKKIWLLCEKIQDGILICWTDLRPVEYISLLCLLFLFLFLDLERNRTERAHHGISAYGLSSWKTVFVFGGMLDYGLEKLKGSHSLKG